MTGTAAKIMQRVSVHDSGRWVCTPKDFLDLGSREAVDQALSRLTKADGFAGWGMACTTSPGSARC